MGLERIAAVMQGVSSNYDIDLFQKLINAIKNQSEGGEESHYRVIADHIRSSAFLIMDGVTPDNDCLLYTSPSPRDRQKSRMPSSA